MDTRLGSFPLSHSRNCPSLGFEGWRPLGPQAHDPGRPTPRRVAQWAGPLVGELGFRRAVGMDPSPRALPWGWHATLGGKTITQWAQRTGAAQRFVLRATALDSCRTCHSWFPASFSWGGSVHPFFPHSRIWGAQPLTCLVSQLHSWGTRPRDCPRASAHPTPRGRPRSPRCAPQYWKPHRPHAFVPRVGDEWCVAAAAPAGAVSAPEPVLLVGLEIPCCVKKKAMFSHAY